MSEPHEFPVTIPLALASPMLGMLSLPGPGAPESTHAVVIVNGGAQYRAGAHRLFVLLARHLAAQGHAVLRFDLPGQGDSPGEPPSFEDTAPHIGAAIDALHQQLPRLQHTTLFGLCDGASASLLYLHATQDPRVRGLALLNPWVRSESGLARAQINHYYVQRLLMPDFWRKLLRGGVGWRSLRDFCQVVAKRFVSPSAHPDAPAFQHAMALAWNGFTGDILLLLSEKDLTAQEFREYANHQAVWRHWSDKAGLTLTVLPGADHTCSAGDSPQALLHQTASWLRANAKAPGNSPHSAHA